ncbi:hypothetical protein CVT25_005150 [Psilocybe cyanescens]|uniref:V-SNARE coiled-coil homology domain-containing protein n=1 Tax=Psilocybe cyanescens TaxID=93625 RepID=A0A409XBQ9_PSICY|nr:hypothetical protein CVT25_005150 [Psilocybe cyanescens]
MRSGGHSRRCTPCHTVGKVTKGTDELLLCCGIWDLLLTVIAALVVLALICAAPAATVVVVFVNRIPYDPPLYESEPYDPYVPRGGAGGSAGGPAAGPSQGNAKTAAIQAQIDDTVGIMRENITKVAERGERLDSLQDKTDNLAVSAQGFRRGANRVRKNMWWKDMKMRIIIGVAIVVILVIIIVSIVRATKN